MSESHLSSSIASGALDQRLSPLGAARREQMLGELKVEMRRMHAARRTRKVLALNAVALAGIIGAFAVFSQPRSPTPSTVTPGVARFDPQGEQPTFAAPAFVITRESTPSDLMDKYAVRTPATTAESLSDAELLAALASIDRPAGLVRTGDRVWLTRDVADPAAAAGSPNSS